MIRLVVTGRSGQVAASLRHLGKQQQEIEVVSLGRPELDLAEPASVGKAIAAARPDLVVNAAAYTAVDRAESEAPLAFAINRDGAAAVAAAAARLGVPLIQLSTDYVFNGEKSGAYVESDQTGPLNVYGQSKLAGEKAVLEAHPFPLILRTSWVFSPFGSNFVKTMLRLGREKKEVLVVDDQIGNPTSALDIAAAILRLAPELAGKAGAPALFHLSGEGPVSWYGFARRIFEFSVELGGPHPHVSAIAAADYSSPARRPRNSQLCCDAFQSRFGFRLRAWREATEETVRWLLAEDKG